MGWVQHSDVLHAAKLVHALYGPSAVTRQSTAETLDNQLMATEFGYDLDDENYEDENFLILNNLVRDAQDALAPLSYQRLQQLSLVVSNRLAKELAITAIYKERMLLLSREQRHHDTPVEVCRRIKLILMEARTLIRETQKFFTPGKRVTLDHKGMIIQTTKKSGSKVPEKPKSGGTSGPNTKQENVFCWRCGVMGHYASKCDLERDAPGTNSEECLWRNSTMGRAWKAAGYNCFTHNVPIPSPSQGSSAPAASTNSGSRRSKCKYNSVSTIKSGSHSSTDFLTVTVSLKSQMERQPAEEANRVGVVAEEGVKISASALLDTGSLAGNFLSDRIVTLLNASSYIYHSKTDISVCSGLDSTCYKSNELLDLVISYDDEINNKKHSIFITSFISRNSPIDLIIGRATIKKHGFYSTNPSHFCGRENTKDVHFTKTKLTEITKTKSTEFTKTKPTEMDESVTPENGMKSQKSKKITKAKPTEVNESVTPENGMKFQKSKILKPLLTNMMILPSSVHACLCTPPLHEVAIPQLMNLDSASCLGSDDLNHSQCDLNPLPSHIIRGWSAPVLQKEGQHHQAEIIDDEIDNEKTDTFAPFLQQTLSDEKVDFISLITFEGDTELKAGCEALCRKYSHLFNDTLNTEPAAIPPFNLSVDDSKWKTYSNRGPVRTQTPAKEAEIHSQVQQLLASGIIEKSPASHYSQVMLAKKPNGKWRFCIDYRRLNDCTESASWPIPNIKNMLARIGTKQSDTFGVMDLTSGYHQAPLTLSSRVYTAFICFAGIYQFTRLPFGPKRAPSYFQEQMASVVLIGLIYIICEMYVDDCIVHGSGNAQFLERLELVFKRFSACKILLQAKKCKFGMKVIEYVGRQISKDGTSMSTEKIQSVVDFPKPTTNTTLRSFLGLANYMRDFVENHSHIVHPLHQMVEQSKGKNHIITWTPAAEAAFVTIKKLIGKSPQLYFADDNEPIVLMTDASDYGIGCHLYQSIKDRKQTVAFVSKSLTETQLRWSVIQKEAYAIFHCVTHLGHLLRDRHFTIKTDHRNLTFMSLDSNAMVIRWYLALQEFDYSLEYIPGDENAYADAMSRICVNKMVSSATLSAILPQRQISEDNYAVIEACHNSIVGHGGVDRTVAKIHSLNKRWDYLTQDVKKFIMLCPTCQKMSQIKIPIHAVKYVASTYSTMQCLNIDFVGPYPDGGYLLVIIDTFTRWVELYPCEAATAQTALDGLITHFGRFGCPQIIRSDRGSHFANELIKEFLQATGTPHNLTLAYSSEENSIVERANKEVNRHIRAYTFDKNTMQNWRTTIPFVQRIINSSHSQRTKISPADLLFGKQVQLDRGILLPFEERPNNTTPLPNRLAVMLAIQEKLIKISQDLLKSTDAQHLAQTSPIITEFEIGTHVLVAYEAGPPTRLLTRWRGPLQILRRHKSEYVLLDLVTGKEKTFHVKNMRIFNFDPLKVQPLDVARHDYDEFFVEKVLRHKGDFRKVSTLTFEVRWLNYSSEHDSWEPWKNLRHSEKLHEYLRLVGKSKLIPPP
jgi:hypothetical protein